MDYLEYLALLGHAEYLDAQGKFAEADKTIRIAQFGGFGGQGGNLGGMFGGRGGGNPGALGVGALVNQAFTGRNPMQNILGTAAAAAAYEQQRKQQSNSGKDALVQAQDKLRQLEEQFARENDPKKKTSLNTQVTEQKTVVENLKKLSYYQTTATPGQLPQTQAAGQSQAQGAFPDTAQLDTRKVISLVATATDAASLNKIISENRFTPREENFAYQIFMMRQQQGGQQQAGQAGAQQAAVIPGQLTPEVQTVIVTLAMDPKSNRNTAWQAITGDSKILPAAKVLALEYYDKLKQDPKYIGQAQANQQSAVPIMSEPEKKQADNMLSRVLDKDFKGDRYQLVKNQYAFRGINKAQYDYIIKEMQDRLGVLARPAPTRPAPARPPKR